MNAPDKTMQQAARPADVLTMLKQGNERFQRGESEATGLLDQVAATKGGQSPWAAVLGCIDSRVPIEYVFDQTIGGLFCARLAGNVVNGDVLGSIEYACAVAGSRLVLVLGHSSCGAVMGACDGVELGHVTGLLERIKPAVDSSAPDVASDERNSSNAAFVESVVERNVHLGVEEIRSRSTVLRELEESGEIAIVGAVYDIATGAVTFYDEV
ncbi:MAG: carbonic anhydrase family protein [Planctomycetota bacterium]